MSTLPWSDELYLREMRPSLPGCPVAVMAGAVHDAARDFFAAAKSWRHKTSVSTVPGQGVYPLDLPDGAEACMLLETSCLGVDLRAPDELVFPDPPRQPGFEVRLVLACKPSRACEGMEESRVSDWTRGIAAGAMSRLMMAPNKEWTNPALAAVHAKEFRVQSGKALIRAARSSQVGSDSYSMGGAGA